MVIELVSPLGYPKVEAQSVAPRLGNALGRKVGFIWNQYQTTRNFWPRLERLVEQLGEATAVERAYKKNTWMPLESDRFDELVKRVDYLIVGVGA